MNAADDLPPTVPEPDSAANRPPAAETKCRCCGRSPLGCICRGTDELLDYAWQRGREARALRFVLTDNPYNATLNAVLAKWWSRGWAHKDEELRAEALEALPHQVGLLLWKGLGAALPLMLPGARDHIQSLLGEMDS